ncbi:taurine transport system substrate-binding protein [Alkalibacterium subtropicum]|uniref:Taurine transport system substrate-binding protein n=1 Tax=Alkalibacterium subtropicum TaxID=753702 RepID=A0A1I1GWE9_9LACT|nr:ABC transporter substrate-binding protein [Alkalibacterium subtropicum]SFC16004.1 taurine transport system substrate-binding protein [Alkalibacterium subtropicum]
MMKMKNITNLVFAVSSLGALSLAGCSSGTTAEPNQVDEINIGYLRVPNDEMVSLSSGLYEEHFAEKGIKTNFIAFDSGVDANKALASGSIDFASMGNTNGIIALATDIGAEMIWIHEVLGEIEALAVREGAGIEEIKDLEGRKIATTFASTSHYSLLQSLKEEGISDEVELLDMQTMDIVAAWERGDIDAAYTWQPSLGKLLEDGKTILSSAEVAEMGHKTANVLLTRQAFSEQNPEIVADFIEATIAGGDIYRQDSNEAAEIVSESLEIDPEDALKQMEGSLWLSPEDQITQDYLGTTEKPGDFSKVMKETGDFLEEQGSIQTSPEQSVYDGFIDPQFIERVLGR